MTWPDSIVTSVDQIPYHLCGGFTWSLKSTYDNLLLEFDSEARKLSLRSNSEDDIGTYDIVVQVSYTDFPATFAEK